MSGESQRRLLFIIVSISIAAIIQAYRITIGKGDIWAVIALICFSLIVLGSGWQLWYRHGTEPNHN